MSLIWSEKHESYSLMIRMPLTHNKIATGTRLDGQQGVIERI